MRKARPFTMKWSPVSEKPVSLIRISIRFFMCVKKGVGHSSLRVHSMTGVRRERWGERKKRDTIGAIVIWGVQHLYSYFYYIKSIS